MTNGLQIRAQIDSELVRGLLLINGGGAVALLALLPTIIDKPDFAPLSRAILYGLLAYLFGLTSAVLHNRLRRVCSLVFEAHEYKPPPGKILGISVGRPTVCFVSVAFMWASLVCFLGGGFIVFFGGRSVL